MSFLPKLASKVSGAVGASVSVLGVALSFASHYAPFVLPFLSPRGQAALGSAVTALGTAQAVLSSSVLPKVNAIAATASLKPPAPPAAS
jgi:hypothetical protein